MISTPPPSWTEVENKPGTIPEHYSDRETKTCGWRAAQRTQSWPLVTLHCLLHPLTRCHFQTCLAADSMSPFISPNSQQLLVFVILELPACSAAGNGSSQASGAIGKSLLPSHGVGHTLPSICSPDQECGRGQGFLPHMQPWQPSSAGRRLQFPGSTPPHPATGICQMNAPALELTPLGSCSNLESNNLQGTIQTSFVLFNLRLTEFLPSSLRLRPPWQRVRNKLLKFFC